MSEKRCTLRDIALQCNVSTAIVSTVLNGKESRIRCSQEKRKQILDAAKAASYHPNIFARSIRKKNIPIIGLFIHHYGDNSMVINDSVRTKLNIVTSVLNMHHLEVLVAPFITAEDQMKRMQELISPGLIGGIITDIIPEKNEEICRFLQKSGLPYAVLGRPQNPETYCAYTSDLALENICLIAAGKAEKTNCITVAPGEKDSLVFRRMPYPDHYIWSAPELPLDQVLADANRTFFVVMGTVLMERMRSFHLQPDAFYVIEPAFLKGRILENEHTVFLQERDELKGYLEKSFCPWVEKGTLPNVIQCPLERRLGSFTFGKRT